jgi:hypothetical protein
MKHKVPPLRFAAVGMTELLNELAGHYSRSKVSPCVPQWARGNESMATHFRTPGIGILSIS